MEAIRSEGHVIGSKVSAVELEQIKQLVTSGVYLNTSDFVRDAIRDKLAAIKTIKYRDVDYDTAKKEVMGYFQERGEAYPSEIEEDLELDYKLICQIADELASEKAIELDPKNVKAWNNKGIALGYQGKYDEALQAFEKAIELDPKNAKVWNHKGDALNALGKYDEAVKAYDKAIEIDPQYARAWYSKGFALEALGRATEADAAYAKAKELGYSG